MNNAYRPSPWWRVNRGKRSRIRPHSHPRYPSRRRPIRQDGIGAHAPIAWPFQCPTALCRFQSRQSSMARYLTPPQARSASVPGTHGLCVVILPPTPLCAFAQVYSLSSSTFRIASRPRLALTGAAYRRADVRAPATYRKNIRTLFSVYKGLGYTARPVCRVSNYECGESRQRRRGECCRLARG